MLGNFTFTEAVQKNTVTKELCESSCTIIESQAKSFEFNYLGFTKCLVMKLLQSVKTFIDICICFKCEKNAYMQCSYLIIKS